MPIINEKFDKLSEITLSMANPMYRRRPDCNHILESIIDWTLNENNIKLLKLFDKIPELLKSPDNEFFLNFLESKSNTK